MGDATNETKTPSPQLTHTCTPPMGEGERGGSVERGKGEGGVVVCEGTGAGYYARQ